MKYRGRKKITARLLVESANLIQFDPRRGSYPARIRAFPKFPVPFFLDHRMNWRFGSLNFLSAETSRDLEKIPPGLIQLLGAAQE